MKLREGANREIVKEYLTVRIGDSDRIGFIQEREANGTDINAKRSIETGIS